MNGTCGHILLTADPTCVIKRMYTHKPMYKRNRYASAPAQVQLQNLARNWCLTMHLAHLYVPAAWDADGQQYTMERISVTTPIWLDKVKTHPIGAELQRFFQMAHQAGIFPADFELYEQPDGRVAMVDFDKFGTWHANDGSVTFGWGLHWAPEQVQQSLAELGVEIIAPT